MRQKEYLISVFEETLEDIKSGEYDNGNSVIEISEMDYLLNNSKMYTELNRNNYHRHSIKFDTKIFVENIDTFLMAKKLGSSCVVLNMASSKNPGGGVERGSRAQEEDLCRRSDLVYSLYSFSLDKSNIFGYKDNNYSYPIPTYGGIYSPRVCVFRDTNYSYLKTPFITNVISVAGVVRPEINKNGKMKDKYISITKGKIRTILRIASDNGHTKLVLGALGCGAFKNPPRHVAELFYEVFREKEFDGLFEEIHFAILEDSNSIRIDNPEGNFKPFFETFNK